MDWSFKGKESRSGRGQDGWIFLNGSFGKSCVYICSVYLDLYIYIIYIYVGFISMILYMYEIVYVHTMYDNRTSI